MKARKKGGDPKRSPGMEPMKPISLDESLRREADARTAMSSSKPGHSKEFEREGHKPFGGGLRGSKARYEESETVRHYPGGRHTTTNVKYTDREPEPKMVKRPVSTPEPFAVNKKGDPIKKGNPRKTKARYQDGGKVPKAQKKEDKEVAKSVAGSRYVGTGDKAMNYDANSLKKAQQATDKLVDLDMRAIKKRLSEEEKSSMKSTRDSLRSLINENIVGPDAAVMYGQTKKRWQMKND
jgi:hypothetical protein